VSTAIASTRIAVMAKAPRAGHAKTRLAPALGANGAAALAALLLDHAVAQATAAALGPVTLWGTPDADHPAFERARVDHGVALAVQCDGDLGARMAHVFDASFAAAGSPLLLMGSDAPGLVSALLRDAAHALIEHDAVLVPALDGGYALLGLRSPAPWLFDAMPWSTPRVMAETRTRIAAAGLHHVELPAVADIDLPGDLVHLPPGWLEAIAAGSGGGRRGSEAPPTSASRSAAATIAACPAEDIADAHMTETTPRPSDDPVPESGAEPLPPPATASPEIADAAPEAAPAGGAEEPAVTPTAAEPSAATRPDTPTPAAGAEAPPKPAELTPAEVAALLAERFPALFGAGRALPIKLRIHADIQQRAPGVFTRKALSTFFHRYTTSTAYLKTLTGATHRIDLDGAPAGEVADEHRQAAIVELERRRSIFEARRTAEAGAQRAPTARREHGPRAKAGGAAPADAGRRGSQEGGPAQPHRRRGPSVPSGDAAPHGPRARPHREVPAPARDRQHASTAPLPQGIQDEPRTSEPAPPGELGVEDAARRERALLLRSFESSTLNRANFCVLKRISESDLEAALLLARQERDRRSREVGPKAARDVAHGPEVAAVAARERPAGAKHDQRPRASRAGEPKPPFKPPR
jgi:rSAM/selenodomain-associated transferase 1